MKNAIEIKDLYKVYGDGRNTLDQSPALDHVDLNIPRGSIFGLLGPNGAGKSTMINIMAGLVKKTSGSMKIWDIDIDKDERNARAAIGVVPQEINFDPYFTPLQILDIQAGFYGVSKAERKSSELLDMVGLADKADAYTRTLSGGMKRRLMVAKALVHRPPILVLDEPTAGVDVELRQMLWEKVRRLNQKGVTVLLTTHYLEEAEQLCDRIAIINHGRIVANEDKDTLLSQIDAKEIRFKIDNVLTDLPPELGKYQAQIEGRRTLMIRYRPADMCVGEMIAAVQNAGLHIVDVSTDESDLEDVFLQITRAANAA